MALRSGDLAYLHVHPEGTPGDGKTEPGPDVVFFAEVPSPDQYRLYLDFKHEGVVRTAAFAVTASAIRLRADLRAPNPPTPNPPTTSPATATPTTAHTDP